MHKRFAVLAAALWLAAGVVRAEDKDGLPGGGTANEVGPAIVTEEYPTIRVSLWCASPTVACQGVVTVEANTCPNCPYKIMNGPDGTANPPAPDQYGRTSWVWLAPRMYSYRCNLQTYATGTFACHVERVK